MSPRARVVTTVGVGFVAVVGILWFIHPEVFEDRAGRVSGYVVGPCR